MRIARVLTRMNLGGPARQVLASDPLLAARGHQVRVFCGQSGPGEGDLTEIARGRGLDVVRVPGLRRGLAPAGDLRARRFLVRELARFGPDVVHTHATKAGLVGRRSARGVPTAARVHTFHGHVLEGYFPEPISRRLAALEARLARETDRIVCVSHRTADDVVRLGVCTEEHIVVCPPGVDLAPFLAIGERTGELRRAIGADEETVLLGVVGRLAEVKRPDWALAVFEALASRHPELQLAFIGDGDQRGQLERAIRALPPERAARVHLLGAREDVTSYLADLDLVLLTSRTEGLPVALIEAAAAGLPAVATPVGGVPELVVHERTGWLGETPDELAYGVAQLLDQPAERRATGQRARLRVQKTHTAEALADRLEALYEAVRAERDKRPGGCGEDAAPAPVEDAP